jgi:hypothetical protein
MFPRQAAYTCPPLPPRRRLSRPPRTMGGSDALEAVGFPSFRWGQPTCSTGLLRSPRRLGSGLRRCQGFPVRGSRSVCLAIASLASACAAQDPLGPPKFLTLLSTHTTLFVDPGRPSGISPSRSLCVGFWGVNTIAVCVSAQSRGCLKLEGVRSPLRSTWFPVSASTVSFGDPLPPAPLQHSVGVVGETLLRRDSHPARSAKLRLAH